MNRNIPEQDKRVSSHLAIYKVSEYGKNTCICENSRVCHAAQSWKNPNSPKQITGASRAFACRQTCRQEQWSDRQCVGRRGQSQLDLTSPFNYVLCGYYLSPSNAVKSLNRSDNGWWAAEKQEWMCRFRQEARGWEAWWVHSCLIARNRFFCWSQCARVSVCVGQPSCSNVAPTHAPALVWIVKSVPEDPWTAPRATAAKSSSCAWLLPSGTCF